MKDKEGNEVKLVFVGRKSCTGCHFCDDPVYCPEDKKGTFVCNKLFNKLSIWKKK